MGHVLPRCCEGRRHGTLPPRPKQQLGQNGDEETPDVRQVFEELVSSVGADRARVDSDADDWDTGLIELALQFLDVQKISEFGEALRGGWGKELLVLVSNVCV